MTGQVSLYNPRTTPPEQLEAMLVGRDALLKEVLDNLREQTRARTRQHWLLRGPRGMGKTHLTGIIHHRVQVDPELSQAYLPLWLGEADVYEVYSPATLLERIAERLVEAVPDSVLGASLHSLVGVGDEEGFFQELSRLLSQEADHQKKTLLVLMENLDALLEGFAPKERDAQLRQLRSLLLHDTHFLFISTTPTRYLAELTNPKKPLYNQFKERSLKPLSVEEVGTVFSKLAVLTGRQGMEQVLGTGQEGALRRKVIHQLTGGLPRSVVMAFGVMQDKSGIQALVEDLRRLLDAQTAYFEARLARLAPRERAIVTALALAEENLTLKEVAGRSRLPEKPLSTLMSRLVQDGHVEITVGAGGRGTVYGLSEGLFRLWYQYRKGRFRLEPLIRLLAYLFNASELQDTITSLKQRVANDAHESRESARLALRQAEEALRLATSEEGRRDRERLWKECLEDAQAAQAAEEHDRIIARILHFTSQPLSGTKEARDSSYSELVTHVLAAAAPLPETLARDCVNHLHAGLVLFTKGDPHVSAQAMELLLHQLDAIDVPALRGAIPFVQLSFAMDLDSLGRHEDALRHTEEALRQGEDDDSGKYIFHLAIGIWLRAQLLKKTGRIPEAIRAYKQFIRRAGARASGITLAGFQAAFSLAILCREAGDWREEEHALRTVVQLGSITTVDDKERARLGYAAFRIIKLGMEHGRFTPTELIAAFEQWFEDHPHHELNEAARTLFHSVKPILETLREEDPAIAAAAFLADPASFYSLLPPQRVRQLLASLETRLPPEKAASLRLHLLITEVLEISREKGTSSRLKGLLGRIPPELRQMVQELLEQKRERPRNMHATATRPRDSGRGM